MKHKPTSLRRQAQRLVTQRLTTRTFQSTTTGTSTTMTMMIPRAAVSTVVQCPVNEKLYYYLLVQRGKNPNKGMWSLPGGKLEWGESTLVGALRELSEETIWSEDDWKRLQWYSQTLCATDSIGEGYHYLIAQCFARVVNTTNNNHSPLPELQAADDAANVDWFTILDVEKMLLTQTVTPGVLQVILRAQELSENGLLPVVQSSTVLD